MSDLLSATMLSLSKKYGCNIFNLSFVGRQAELNSTQLMNSTQYMQFWLFPFENFLEVYLLSQSILHILRILIHSSKMPGGQERCANSIPTCNTCFTELLSNTYYFFLIFANVIGIGYAIYITNVAEHTYLLAILYVPFDTFYFCYFCKFLNDWHPYLPWHLPSQFCLLSKLTNIHLAYALISYFFRNSLLSSFLPASVTLSVFPLSRTKKHHQVSSS